MSTFVSDARGTRIAIGLVPVLYDEVDESIPFPNAIDYTFKLDNVVVGVIRITDKLDGTNNYKRIG